MTWAPTWNQYPKRAPDLRWVDNWEDDPAREHRAVFDYRRREPNQQRKLHLGLAGPGAFLKKIIENERRQAANKREQLSTL